MPRGVPKAGFRRPRGSLVKKALNVVRVHEVPVEEVSNETDEEIEQKLNDRFDVLEDMTRAVADGDVRSLIVSGPGGLGKSHTVETILSNWDPDGVRHSIIKGYVRAPGLFKLLHSHRFPGQVLVFDDADTIFADETSINLLKCACDSNKRRVLTYASEGTLIDDETAERLPKSFLFEGSIVFISNKDFDAEIERGNKFAPHMEALMTRSHYIDLAMRTRRDYMIRIRQVVRKGILTGHGLSKEAQNEVLSFIEENQDRLREMSLRVTLKVADIRKRNRDNWRKTARITCCVN